MADLVIAGQVVLRATPAGVETAEAIAVRDGRVVAIGRGDEVTDAVPGARIHRAAGVVVPGLHDFHLHLVGMARARREVNLDRLDAREAVTAAIAGAAAATPAEGWLRGRGWREETLDVATLNGLPELRRVPALVYSHDAHSVWASPAALERAGLAADAPGPAGGRIERTADGALSGVLRERAADAVEAVAERLGGPVLEVAVRETIAELAGLGITGATDAGDTAAENGVGWAAALGDRASRLLEMRNHLEGRIRLTINVPAAAIEAAAELGMATGRHLPGSTTLRGGWAKAYADGALGSRTAALFDEATCGGGSGILRMSAADLDNRLRAGRRHGIGLAVHAIGDRAASAVLDALERAGALHATVRDRIEHLQLVRAEDQRRLARLGVVASVQPIHAASDRSTAEACWADRLADAYPWRGLAEAGALLACGSDAPIESVNPWLGIFAAVHRRHVTDRRGDWLARQSLGAAAALSGYTTGPARGVGADNEGHLAPGAVADLACLDVDLATLLAADERLAEARSELTLVGGRIVHGG